MEEGDIVVAYGHFTILDIGIVDGPYFLSIDHLVKPHYDLYGHRKPTTWLKLGPITIANQKVAQYLAQENTIFEIIDHQTLKFIQEALDKSFQYRIKRKIDSKLPKSRKRVSYEIDEDEVAEDMKEFSKVLSTNKEQNEIDVAEEFKNLKLQAAPDSIQTSDQVRAQVIITGSRALACPEIPNVYV